MVQPQRRCKKWRARQNELLASELGEAMLTASLRDENRDLFKRAFLLYIQKCFLLPTSTANISLRALPTIFNMENTRHQNWALHIHNFLLEEVQKTKDNSTNSVSGCCIALMVIYFHETHFGKNSREAEAQPPWI
ncbi:hypothetical protein PIB30_017616 [Stylosanthes scabra]|uniref:Uncharacterized protein n=1 Tax=Stylosanthes scabra TaxID=79078 RepID=A0ABU6V9A8_9FABA|nr:hypothetical protein [Stylosanthes scabra]